jgi:hypothetical protein
MFETPTCPRCESKSDTIAASPVANEWLLYACSICFFTWRSSEPPEAIDPKQYPAIFKIDPLRIPALSDFPVIPQRFRK